MALRRASATLWVSLGEAQALRPLSQGACEDTDIMRRAHTWRKGAWHAEGRASCRGRAVCCVPPHIRKHAAADLGELRQRDANNGIAGTPSRVNLGVACERFIEVDRLRPAAMAYRWHTARCIAKILNTLDKMMD